MLKIENLNKIFYTKKGKFLALKDINLEILSHKVTAIVGESGSGKSTLANIILGVLQADSGKLSLQGENLSIKRSLSLKRKIAWVGQNPLSALNPYHTIESSISLPIKVHSLIKDKNKIKTRVSNLLEMVDLPKSFASRYPNSLSGGQRQRVAIARAIALEPEIILLDEPTSALDVLVQAKVLKLLVDLKEKFNMTYIFITHDLGVVRSIADEIVVMKGGEMIEHCESDIFFKNPTNPYILELLSHIPCVSQQEQDYKEKLIQKEFNK